MRVVLALGSDDLTTKQLRKRVPDVAQASLYRAITRLVDAGIIAVVERRQRGGAMERVYRVVKAPQTEPAVSTAQGFAAAADTVARALSVDAAQWAASPSWRTGQAHLRREVLHLNAEQLAEFNSCVTRTFDELAALQKTRHAPAWIVTCAAIPASAESASPGQAAAPNPHR